MEININLTYGEESVHNLAFVKALLIKYNIESLNVSFSQKETIKKHILEELKIIDK